MTAGDCFVFASYRHRRPQEDSARRSEEYFASRYPVDRGEYLADIDPEDLGDIEEYKRQLANPPPALVPLDQAKQEVAA